MAAGVPARLTAAEGRKFAYTVGAAFLVLGGILAWRGRAGASIGMLGTGFALLVAGLVAPTRLDGLERVWMGFAHLISKVTTPVVMGVIYFLVLTPTGLARRFLGKNPLVHSLSGDSYWHRVTPRADRVEAMKRQF